MYASREEVFYPEPCPDYAPENCVEYKEKIDVAVSTGHSAREAQPRSRWLMLADLALASATPLHRSDDRSADLDALRRRANQAYVEVLDADLDLAQTMARIASSAQKSSEKRQRNIRSARRAYGDVLRRREKVGTTAAQRHRLGRKLTELRMALEDLGEDFQSLPVAA